MNNIPDPHRFEDDILNNIINDVKREIFHEIFKKLDKKERFFIQLYYFEQLSIPDISLRLNTSIIFCYEIRKRVTKKLIKNLNDEKYLKLLELL